MDIDVNNAQPVEVVARAVGYLAQPATIPMKYAGRGTSNPPTFLLMWA